MSDPSGDGEKMGFNATWSMAVGGMVGGGIFSVLGVVIETAGVYAWLSFVLAGLVAFLTGYAYVRLAVKFDEGGGAFTFLRHERHPEFAGGLSWVLIVGYVLTLAVYAFTFGHYLSHVLELGGLTSRIAAVSIVAVLVGVNLLGVGEASIEIFTRVQLIVLVGLGIWGLVEFAPAQLRYDDAAPGGPLGALVGAATIFMAYEGFQLLTYDQRSTAAAAPCSAILAVIGAHVLVALASASLVGAGTIVEQKEIALAVAGEEAAGLAGKIVVSVAAVFSTASAINATLFATARLARRVAKDGELPAFFGSTNSKNIPTGAVIALGATGGALAALGNLDQLVEAASLTFLFTFATVNVLAARADHGWRAVVHWVGVALAGASTLVLGVRLAENQPASLIGLGVVVAAAAFLRPWLLKRAEAEG
ncbi:MAG: APC family permease [Planctomycetota bacterium]